MQPHQPGAATPAPPPPPPAPAAAVPPPGKPGRPYGGRKTPVQGEKVDYYSTTYKCWIPAIVAVVDPESGSVTLNVKQQALSLLDQQNVLRPRTKPSQERLTWVRQVLREGRIDEEARKLFSHHCASQRDAGNIVKVLLPEALGHLGAEIDRLLGVSGCVVPLQQELQVMRLNKLLLDDFVSLFWGILANVQHEYGQVLPRKEGTHRREDPRNAYDFSRQLGKGTYGVVVLGVNRRTKAKRAIKSISKQKMRYNMEQLQMEIDHLCLLDHPHIVKLYEYYDDKDYVYLVTDLCSGGDLQQAVRKRTLTQNRFQERYVAEVMRQVISGIAHVHARGIVHLDIKAANIMLMPSKSTLMPVESECLETMVEDFDKPHVVIIDLGVAQLFNPGNFNFNKPNGTPATMAPEVWRGTVTPKADVFSMGVVLFELLSLKLPLKVPGDREGGAKFWSTTPHIKWELLQPCSQTAEELCKQMMTFDRLARPSALQCLDAPFLRDYCMEDQLARMTHDNSANVSPEIVRRLSKLPERSLLYKSIALSIAREWPANQMPTIKRAFQEFSKGSAGTLTVKQVSVILQNLGVSDSIAIKAADAMDMNRDGSVDFTEFVAGCTYLGSDEFEKYLYDMFQEADSDDDDLLSQGDVSKLLPAEQTGEVVRDVFAGLTGRTEAGARVDWDTFRRHFKSRENNNVRRAPGRSSSQPSRPERVTEGPIIALGESQASEQQLALEAMQEMQQQHRNPARRSSEPRQREKKPPQGTWVLNHLEEGLGQVAGQAIDLVEKFKQNFLAATNNNAPHGAAPHHQQHHQHQQHPQQPVESRAHGAPPPSVRVSVTPPRGGASASVTPPRGASAQIPGTPPALGRRTPPVPAQAVQLQPQFAQEATPAIPAERARGADDGATASTPRATPSKKAPPPVGFQPAVRSARGKEAPEEQDLQRLKEMGFEDRDFCVAALQRHNNELTETCVAELLR